MAANEPSVGTTVRCRWTARFLPRECGAPVSVDVELVALRVFHRDRVVIDLVLAQVLDAKMVLAR
jgi:hypothetical protein